MLFTNYDPFRDLSSPARSLDYDVVRSWRFLSPSRPSPARSPLASASALLLANRRTTQSTQRHRRH